MTRSEFITNSIAFPTGSMVVVSGKTLSAVMDLLNDAKTEIETQTSNPVLVFDAKETVLYDQRGHEYDVEAARIFEYVKVISSGTFVVLVANEHDRDAPGANAYGKRNVIIDTCLDIFDAFKVKNIHYAFSPVYGITREIWAFMNKLYYYNVDTSEVILIKTQDADR
jgi:hypothetical protein